MSVLAAYTYSVLVVGKPNAYELTVDVDLGFNLWRRGLLVRLAGKGAAAQVEAAQVGKPMVVTTVRYSNGRYLARILPDGAEPAYQYAATVVGNHDGDTLSANVDLGFDMWMRGQPIRLTGCNARELADAGGREARDQVKQLVPAGTQVQLSSMKDDKYGGRYNGIVIMPGGMSLAQVLVATGWAAAWDGTGSKPVPPWPRTV